MFIKYIVMNLCRMGKFNKYIRIVIRIDLSFLKMIRDSIC